MRQGSQQWKDQVRRCHYKQLCNLCKDPLWVYALRQAMERQAERYWDYYVKNPVTPA